MASELGGFGIRELYEAPSVTETDMATMDQKSINIRRAVCSQWANTTL